MRGKIIYVDFVKRRRITFIHFHINRFISWFNIKFYIKTKTSSLNNMSTNKRRRILN
ncbi:hypothetical protein B0I63_000471 [Clostridium beijerinckii]|uniref:Uncharacterized protein n=1 Tax=Clostridium beijerinckii TaxID=1520 RepID=A0A9Q5GMN0_CLOBE|nr:hypothetical protein CLBIJ_03110 [Clostridium beijerinckii]MBA2886335.1 hypothetical protein [Clostridium beijerinckii]MBA2901069.1 hypothetical protein [Clostridium beijerinckii]MBA2910894.1 hypothetical protein [Clostridium beijerinckii]MBA9017537.1 hypothetical protein [Clostridium beijerinckii]